MRDSSASPATPGRTDATAESGQAIRFCAAATLAALAAITAVISYQHGMEVVRAAGNTGLVVYLVPVVADLLIFASSLALLEAARADSPKPPLAVTGLLGGIGATVVMNVAAGWPRGAGACLVNALAPVALVLSIETLMGLIRRGRQHVRQATVGAEPSHPVATLSHCGHVVAETAEQAVALAYLHGRDCLGDAPSLRRLSAITGVSRSKVAELVRGVAEPTPEPARVEPATEADQVPA